MTDEQIAEWAKQTCLLFGTSLHTAHLVAGTLTQGVMEARLQALAPAPGGQSGDDPIGEQRWSKEAELLKGDPSDWQRWLLIGARFAYAAAGGFSVSEKAVEQWIENTPACFTLTDADALSRPGLSTDTGAQPGGEG